MNAPFRITKNVRTPGHVKHVTVDGRDPDAVQVWLAEQSSMSSDEWRTSTWEKIRELVPWLTRDVFAGKKGVYSPGQVKGTWVFTPAKTKASRTPSRSSSKKKAAKPRKL